MKPPPPLRSPALPISASPVAPADTIDEIPSPARLLAFGFSTVVLILLIQRFAHGMLANLSVLFGLLAGTALDAHFGGTGIVLGAGKCALAAAYESRIR